MKQHVVYFACLLLAVFINVALCDTFYLDFKESRRDLSVVEHRFRIREASRFVPNTYDSTVNEYCTTGDTYNNLDLPNSLVCIKDGVAHLISETDHQKSQGKISIVIPRVYVKSTSSREQEKLGEKVLEVKAPWYYQNSTCMTGRRDTLRCIDKDGKHIVDATIQRKPCYFVHGVGESGDNTIRSSFTEYWGTVNDYMPQCNSFNFLYMDTRNNSWTSEFLVKKTCSLITAGTMKIVNSYVYTHSMGGLTMTNGLMRGWCEIDKRSSRLYMSQPPLKGSVTARFVNDICKGIHGDVLKTVADYMDYCRPNNTGANPAYYPMDPSNPALKSVQYAAGVFNDGMLCGDCEPLVDVCGIGPPWQSAGLKAIAITSGLEFPNDGMVSLDSCQVTNPKQPYQELYSALYYKGPMNHADGTCRNGDSILQSLYPCKWFGTKYMS